MGNYQMFYYDLDANESTETNHYIDLPRLCMHCRNTGEQIPLNGVMTVSDDDFADGIIFSACQYCHATSMHYLKYISGLNGGRDYYEIAKSFPEQEANLINLPESLAKDFKDFTNIYNQATKAESIGLDHVSGMAYRKALEFLVTDFLLKYPPENITQDWLKDTKTTLGQKINNLPNERVKKLSKAISYIGNDETHYTRRHPEHDIESIKMFIKALLSDIENEIILQEAEKLLNKSK
ncbi:hypothetical protein [Enterococcus larvae]|uniref:hypothetical protein n=1 Tax=Enterococcus larvae TaxID=2794352 RepID=UPI003F3A87EF